MQLTDVKQMSVWRGRESGVMRRVLLASVAAGITMSVALSIRVGAYATASRQLPPTKSSEMWYSPMLFPLDNR